MYAVIETGGKQYRVTPGDVIDVERDAAVGDDGAVRFERVLMVGGDGDVQVGTPLVEGALVRASLVGEVRGPKIKVFKMKRRKGYRRTAGHRQDLLRVKIDGIDGAGESKARPAKKKAAEEPAAEKPAKKAAEKPAAEKAEKKPAAEKAKKKSAAEKAEKKPAGEKKAAAAKAPEKKTTKKKAEAAEAADAAGDESAEKE